ncbi:MAG TPA: hypothetical protein VKZ53_18500 [Candidatus Angelobacter sp.]|nr:hypothetical protein [Candidatus Angelobacter sp.]
MKVRPTASTFLASPYDPAIEREFFSGILLPCGMFKTTYQHRLDDINQRILPLLANTSRRPLDIMDVGVSSGVSTQEWSDHLRAAGVEANMIGTDSCLRVRLLTFGPIEAILDDRNKPIDLSFFGRGVPVWGSAYQLPVIFVLRSAVSAARFLGAQTRPLLLQSKALRTVMLVEDDILSDDAQFHGNFDVVRAANILTPAYFSKSTLLEMIQVLKRRLRPGGLLVVCRTEEKEPQTNHGTIFRLKDDRLYPIARVGGGSEIESLIENCDPVAMPALVHSVAASSS